MNVRELIRQLQRRRVFRTALIYVALLWALLQAADLIAGAGIITASTVRGLIVAGALGLPVVLFASWFLESPFRDRHWLSALGDLSVIAALSVAMVLFAWQQWFASSARPIIAVLQIEATDLNDNTRKLADHLEQRIRMLLATRAAIRVTETSSSQHSALDDLAGVDVADVLGADYLLAGSLSRGGDSLRMSLQLKNPAGDILWSDVFEERLIDLASLQRQIVVALSNVLAFGPTDPIMDIISDCEYPSDIDATLAAAGVGVIEAEALENTGSGLLLLAESKRLFAELDIAPLARKPLLQQIAMQRLADAETSCPGLPEIEALRIRRSNVAVDSQELLERHPNDAALYRRAAESRPDDIEELLTLAHELDPANPKTLCYFWAQQTDVALGLFLPAGCQEQ